MKLKKIAVISAAVAMMMCSVPSIGAYAAPAPSTDPRMYADLVYEEGGNIRVDVVMENMPDLMAGGFQVDVGDGWSLVYKTNGKTIDIKRKTADYAGGYSAEKSGNGFFFTFDSTFDVNLNGVLLSFYVTRNSNNSPLNSAINIDLSRGLLYSKNNPTFNANYAKNPHMDTAYQYKVGDVTGDGYIDSVDASNVKWLLSHYGSKSVEDFYEIVTFEYPTCPMAFDADGDGYITSDDAQMILDSYANLMVGKEPLGNVGLIDYYEHFDS